MTTTATRHIVISGKVQGVGYRDFVVRNALRLKVTGWIRNLRDGRVEMLATGEDEALSALIDACREGPPMARVDQVDSNAAEPGRDKGFTKRFTA